MGSKIRYLLWQSRKRQPTGWSSDTGASHVDAWQFAGRRSHQSDKRRWQSPYLRIGLAWMTLDGFPIGRNGYSHNTEYAAWSQTTSVGIHGDSTTCRWAADFEEVRAFIHGADKGSCGHVWRSVTVTKERHNSRLSARRDIGTSHVIVVRTRRAIGIIEDEFAAAEQRLRCLLSVYDRESLAK